MRWPRSPPRARQATCRAGQSRPTRRAEPRVGDTRGARRRSSAGSPAPRRSRALASAAGGDPWPRRPRARAPAPSAPPARAGPQAEPGAAVFLVVGSNLVEPHLALHVKPVLVIENGLGPRPHGARPREAEERLELLERVARYAGAEGPANDAVEIHEDPAPEQIVDLRVPGHMLGHEPLERARPRPAEG